MQNLIWAREFPLNMFADCLSALASVSALPSRLSERIINPTSIFYMLYTYRIQHCRTFVLAPFGSS